MNYITFWVIFITLISKIIGLTRDLTLSYVFGISEVSDIYIIGTTIPALIFGFISTAVTTCFIPDYQNISYSVSKEKANIFTNKVILLMIVSCAILSAIVFISTPQILQIFGYTNSHYIYNLGCYFVRFCVLQVFISSITCVFFGYLQANNYFLISVASGIPMDICMIIGFFVCKNTYRILPFFFLLAYFMQLLFLVPNIRQTGYKLNFGTKKDDILLKHFLIMVGPVIMGVSVNQLNFLIDRVLAANILIGGVSALNYAHKLDLFIQSIFVTSFITVTYPKLSKQIALKNRTSYLHTIKTTLENVTLWIFPVMIGSFILAKPLVWTLFARGAFNEEAVILTSGLFKLYSLSFLSAAIREVLSRVFYASGNTKTPVRNASVGMLCNIIFNIVLSKFLGLNGLAAATSLSMLLTSVMMVISANKTFSLNKFFKEYLKELLKITLASILMGIFVELVQKQLLQNSVNIVTLAFIILSAAIFYLGITLLFGVHATKQLVAAIKKCEG